MKIAINALALGKTKTGAGRYMSELVNGLAKIDKDNRYFIFTTSFGARQLSVGDNFKIHLLSISRPLRIFWEQTFLPRLIKHYQIDVFHALGFTLPYIKNSKYIVTIHDMTWFDYPEYHQTIKKIYFQKMIPMSLKKADKIITVSNNTKQDVLRYFPEVEKKIVNTYEAVSEVFISTNFSGSKTDHIFNNFNIKGPYIYFVGMIEPRKNLPNLIRAFQILKKIHQIPHQLVITGQKGWSYKSVYDEVRSMHVSDNVVFTGYVSDSDLSLLYKHCDVFVYPSLYEGFGLPVIEAMASGVPVVTSKKSSLQEIAGDAALLCIPEDKEDIAIKIWNIIKDKNLRNKLVKRGKHRVKNFSWEKTALETYKTYTSLISTRIAC